MTERLTDSLVERFKIELEDNDRSGIYAFTQREMAYNSNRIEGSTLTKDQTLALFETGQLPISDDVYKAKDIEEMQGHFLMFNRMLNTLDEPLSESLIKRFHYELKFCVFEDRANGYVPGSYKKRPNIIGLYPTIPPKDIPDAMKNLLDWYHSISEPNIRTIAEFHARYESIHPFQDGNGRTGRMILFRECLVNGIIPPVIQDKNKEEYRQALVTYREEGTIDRLSEIFEKEQEAYLEKCQYFFPEWEQNRDYQEQDYEEEEWDIGD